jgi:hypothetical protein
MCIFCRPLFVFLSFVFFFVFHFVLSVPLRFTDSPLWYLQTLLEHIRQELYNVLSSYLTKIKCGTDDDDLVFSTMSALINYNNLFIMNITIIKPKCRII